MIIGYGDLWEFKTDATVITTNGFVKNNGEAVMGAGCAKEAAKKFPRLPFHLGQRLQASGNHVYSLGGESINDRPWEIFSFPVKDNWWEPAKISLIERSAHELVTHINGNPWIRTVAIPRPGCGNGQLKWEDVEPVLEPILDDRFIVVTFTKG